MLSRLYGFTPAEIGKMNLYQAFEYIVDDETIVDDGNGADFDDENHRKTVTMPGGYPSMAAMILGFNEGQQN